MNFVLDILTTVLAGGVFCGVVLGCILIVWFLLGILSDARQADEWLAHESADAARRFATASENHQTAEPAEPTEPPTPKIQ